MQFYIWGYRVENLSILTKPQKCLIFKANNELKNLKTMKKIMILSGSTNPDLAQNIFYEIKQIDTVKLDKDPVLKDISVFNNGEIDPELKQTVAGADVFIIQTSITGKVNDNFVESLLLIDAAKRARAKAVYLVAVIFPYQRQDRRETNKNHRPKRKAVSARVIADCFSKAVNVNGVISVKLHSEQIEGFFDNTCIVENIDPTILFSAYLEKENVIKNKYQDDEPMVVAPDVGAAKSADDFSNAIGLSTYAILNKRRRKRGESEVTHLIGDCNGRDCIIYDDLIDTANTVVGGAKKLKEEGAKNIYLMAPHAVFSKNAVEKLLESDIEKIIITDSIPNPEVKKYPEKFVVLSLASLLAKVIINIHNSQSLQPLVGHKSGELQGEGVNS